MPIMTAYFGVSVVSVMMYYSDSWYEFVTFPYTYAENLFSSYVDEAHFNKRIIETILRKRKEKPSDFQILTAGFLKEPELAFEPKVSTTIPVLLNSLEGMNPIFANVWGVSLRDRVLSNTHYDADIGFEAGTPSSEGTKFFTDLALYPNICPIDLSIRTHIDHNISELLDDPSIVFYPDFPVVFSGDRFSQYVGDPESDYILMFSLIRKLGIFDLKIDVNNALVHSQLLRMYDQRLRLNMPDVLKNVGTFVNSVGYTECMFEKEIGSKQLIEVEKDSIFIMPFNSTFSGNVSIKNHELGSIDKSISGGNIGLIVDTREQKGMVSNDIRLFNSCLKQLDSAIRGL